MADSFWPRPGVQGRGHRLPIQLSPARAGPALALLLPVVAGLAGTLLAAFGQGQGDAAAPFAAWSALRHWPGLGASLRLTLTTGLLATALSLASALALAVAARRAWFLRLVQAMATPLLAVPHAAMAAGFAFLVAPSGWLIRLASPWLTGWRSPPDLAIVHDRWGAALVAGLWLKETPFLLLATLAALAQVQPGASLRGAASLGYAPWRAWLLVLLPRVWPQLRLPVLAVLVFSLSVVDVAVILGPAAPPPLAVQVTRWFAAPDMARWHLGCAGALLLVGLAGLACAAVLLLERVAGSVGRRLLATGGRGGGGAADRATAALGLLLAALGLASLLVLALWAGAGPWWFPSAMPAHWSGATLAARWGDLARPAGATFGLALAATLAALLLAFAALRRTDGRAGAGLPWWAWLPLLLPQPALLWGQQVLLVRAGLDGGDLALVWSHLQFVLPYVLMLLANPWRALDPRYARAAAALGAGPWRRLTRVTLPLLVRPLLAAAAVGVAVSCGLYLPTVFAGAGRVATLATETVALASGPDRRLAGAAALALAALPLVAFAVAFVWPAWTARRRRGLAVAR